MFTSFLLVPEKTTAVIALPSLIYTSDEQPGYRRLRWGRGFSYRDADNKVLPKTIRRRIEALVIPPAWEDVWICQFENGHLQCTGRDPAGRKQYRYHADWMAFRQASKFTKMRAFARALPHVRRQLDQDLHRPEWDKTRVLALAVSVLDNVHLRIGNQQYARRNATYGLTTLRRRHLDLDGDGDLHLNYKAKSNKYRDVEVDDNELARLIQECAELPGYEVFRYRTGSRSYETIDSHDVNTYIREIAGAAFSAKDFRTWAGTESAVAFYEEARREVAETRKNLETELVRRVAAELGNTVSVCREYYIHPAVLQAVEEERVPSLDSISKKRLKAFGNQMDPAEIVALDLIEAAARRVD